MVHFPCKCPDVDYFQIALCCTCRLCMSPPWLRGPLLINNQLNKGPGMEMSLSGSLRKLQISTCLKLAKKLPIVPTVKCYVFISCTIWNWADKWWDEMESHANKIRSKIFQYQLLQIPNISRLFFSDLHASCKFAQLETGAVLVSCPSKMRLKYMKDISMFNYKPAAFLLCMYGLCVFCVMTACWMSREICQMWRGNAHIYLSYRTQAGDGRRVSHL